MKIIAISQRIDIIEKRDERRDSIDQDWIRLISLCNYVPILIPNHPAAAQQLLDMNICQGVILSGGNDLTSYGGAFPERDETELLLFEHAIKHNLTVVGVCRGMQFIQHYFGVQLEEVTGHIATNHSIDINGTTVDVNSFHRYGTTESVNDLLVTARAKSDDVVEAVSHKTLPIKGIMWHPERYKPFSNRDVVWLKEALR